MSDEAAAKPESQEQPNGAGRGSAAAGAGGGVGGGTDNGRNHGNKEHSPRAGCGFFVVLLVALTGLILFYVNLHEKYPATGKPLSVELLQAAIDARHAVEQKDSAALQEVVTSTRQRLEPLLEARAQFTEADALAGSLRALEKLAPDLAETESEMEGAEKSKESEAEPGAETDADPATGGAGAGETAGGEQAGETEPAEPSSHEQAIAEVHKWAALIVDAGASDSEDPVVTSNAYFWRDSPFRYLEIMFWALLGILVHLLVRIGVYLKEERFWIIGIYQHVALIFSVPLLTFVFVTLLSLVKLEVGFSAQEGTQLDLRDPRILAAISFLVASRPWGLWDYLKSTAGRLFSRQKPDGN